MTKDVELIKIAEVLRITGLKRSTLYALMKHSEDPFPPNYPVSTRGRAWIRAEVEEWCLNRKKARKIPTPIELAIKAINRPA